MNICPCGSEKVYDKCCERYINGSKNAPTAEATMRARYSAFAKHEIDYIEKTIDPDERDDFSKEDIEQWAKNSDWKSLEIVNVSGGVKSDTTGEVEFKANYEVKGVGNTHHEIAQFKKVEEFWYFVDGKIVRNQVIRTAPKVGRNDPCPCKSGKKHKKCCL